MSDKEKNIIEKLANIIPSLSKEKQSYLLGVAEGMAVVRDIENTTEQLEEIYNTT